MPDPEARKRKQKQRTTRHEDLGDSPLAELPDVQHGGQLIQWLHEIGPVESGANGPVPLTWQEIAAWKQATGTTATAEELSIIRQLSKEYVAQYNRSDNPDEPPPNRPRNVDQYELKDQIRSVLRSSAEKRKK